MTESIGEFNADLSESDRLVGWFRAAALTLTYLKINFCHFYIKKISHRKTRKINSRFVVLACNRSPDNPSF
ncbi:MAG: hypothetical protein CM15mP58_03330 [Burkholderiaceae bacterium]|nr:MAG: hypothetical protein CM15mP58_03330 [Burkholderiaceae bacterium]